MSHSVQLHTSNCCSMVTMTTMPHRSKSYQCFINKLIVLISTTIDDRGNINHHGYSWVTGIPFRNSKKTDPSIHNLLISFSKEFSITYILTRISWQFLLTFMNNTVKQNTFMFNEPGILVLSISLGSGDYSLRCRTYVNGIYHWSCTHAFFFFLGPPIFVIFW